MITAKYLRSALTYNRRSGVMRWRWRADKDLRVNRRYAGKIAGTPRSDGYWQIAIDGKLYLRHRLAWLYVKGKWPNPEADHRNLVRGDDRFSNLRRAKSGQNSFNHTVYSTNNSGFRGVSRHQKTGKWQAFISVNNRRVYLGLFRSKRGAAIVYDREVRKRRGKFGRPNFRRAA